MTLHQLLLEAHHPADDAPQCEAAEMEAQVTTALVAVLPVASAGDLVRVLAAGQQCTSGADHNWPQAHGPS